MKVLGNQELNFYIFSDSDSGSCVDVDSEDSLRTNIDEETSKVATWVLGKVLGKRKRDDDDEEFLLQESKDEKNGAGIESLLNAFINIKISKSCLSEVVQDLEFKVRQVLQAINIKNAQDSCYVIAGLLEEFCKETNSLKECNSDDRRTIEFMHRAMQEVQKLCKMGKFSPEIAIETHLKVIQQEFKNEIDISKLSNWLTNILEGFPYVEINGKLFKNAGWSNDEMFVLILLAKNVIHIDLSTVEEFDLVNVQFGSQLQTLYLSRGQFMRANYLLKKYPKLKIIDF